MAISKAKKIANAKYNAVAYDRIELKVPKGKKDEIKVHAEKYQKEVGAIGTSGYSPKGSMTGFITRAINETMERDKSTDTDIHATEQQVQEVQQSNLPEKSAATTTVNNDADDFYKQYGFTKEELEKANADAKRWKDNKDKKQKEDEQRKKLRMLSVISDDIKGSD